MQSGNDINIAARALSQATGREINVAGTSYLFFGGTAYLGVNLHPEFIALFSDGIRQYGINNGTSRTNNVQIGIYDEAERYAAATYGFEDAILMSSGFLAAQLAVEAIGRPGQARGRGTGSDSLPEIIYSPCCHPAIWLDRKPSVSAFGKPGGPVDFQDWLSQTIQRINNSTSARFIVISNAVDNIIPERFDFSPFIGAIDSRKHVHFILDDSHGLGVFNPFQTSVHGQFANTGPNIRVTLVASMAKGMGIDAGLILGDRESLQLMRQTGMYIGASPSAPAFLHSFLKGSEIYQKQWKKLQDNIRYFANNILGNEWVTTPGYPVFYCSRPGLHEILLSKGILISSFPYPDPEDPPASRIVISAAHRREDLDKLISCLS